MSKIPGKFQNMVLEWLDKICWTDRVRNKEVLQRVNEERNIKHTIKRRKANWIDHMLRRNRLLKQVTKGKREE